MQKKIALRVKSPETSQCILRQSPRAFQNQSQCLTVAILQSQGLQSNNTKHVQCIFHMMSNMLCDSDKQFLATGEALN